MALATLLPPRIYICYTLNIPLIDLNYTASSSLYDLSMVSAPKTCCLQLWRSMANPLSVGLKLLSPKWGTLWRHQARRPFLVAIKSTYFIWLKQFPGRFGVFPVRPVWRQTNFTSRTVLYLSSHQYHSGFLSQLFQNPPFAFSFFLLRVDICTSLVLAHTCIIFAEQLKWCRRAITLRSIVADVLKDISFGWTYISKHHRIAIVILQDRRTTLTTQILPFKKLVVPWR